MAEYNLDFADRMLDSSKFLLSNSEPSAAKAAVYNSLIACEIALKSALELAGKPLKSIPWSHNLSDLLELVSKCTIEIEIGTTLRKVSASRIRGRVVDPTYSNATIGHLLHAEALGASKFPNEVSRSGIRRTGLGTGGIMTEQATISFRYSLAQVISIRHFMKFTCYTHNSLRI